MCAWNSRCNSSHTCCTEGWRSAKSQGAPPRARAPVLRACGTRLGWTASAVARRGPNRAATPEPYSLGVLPILRGAGGLSRGPQRAWLGLALPGGASTGACSRSAPSAAPPRRADRAAHPVPTAPPRVLGVLTQGTSVRRHTRPCPAGTSHGGSGSVRAAVGAGDNAAELDGRRASSARSASFSAASRSNATLRSCSCAAEPREHIGRSRNKR